MIAGLGSSPGEGTGYSLQYSWASLVDHMVKNPPAMQETWVQSLGWEDLLEEGMATHSSIPAWRSPMDRGAWRAAFHGVTKSWTRLSTANTFSVQFSSVTQSCPTLCEVKDESEKVSLKLNIQKSKIMASGPITSWKIDGETVETMSDFIFGGSKHSLFSLKVKCM